MSTQTQTKPETVIYAEKLLVKLKKSETKRMEILQRLQKAGHALAGDEAKEMEAIVDRELDEIHGVIPSLLILHSEAQYSGMLSEFQRLYTGLSNGYESLHNPALNPQGATNACDECALSSQRNSRYVYQWIVIDLETVLPDEIQLGLDFFQKWIAYWSQYNYFSRPERVHPGSYLYLLRLLVARNRLAERIRAFHAKEAACALEAEQAAKAARAAQASTLRTPTTKPHASSRGYMPAATPSTPRQYAYTTSHTTYTTGQQYTPRAVDEEHVTQLQDLLNQHFNDYYGISRYGPAKLIELRAAIEELEKWPNPSVTVTSQVRDLKQKYYARYRQLVP